MHTAMGVMFADRSRAGTLLAVQRILTCLCLVAVAAAAPPARAGGPSVRTVATGLQVPWEMAFLPDGSALITERPGRVRRMLPSGRLSTVASVPVVSGGEDGLLGLALDPGFARNGLVYLFSTVRSGNVVTRYRFTGGRLVRQLRIVSGIARASNHDGGRIRFGPDGRLYISTGDAERPSLAQRRGSLNGKLLRLSGAAARGRGGRPAIFSFGHRNMQGFDWQPGTGRLYGDEHGQTGNDEINLLRRGGNYGWPLLEGGRRRAGFAAPLAIYNPRIAPSGATFVRSAGSAWTGDYLLGALGGEHIRRLRLSGRRVVAQEVLFRGRFGRIRTVVEGPDQALYALTNNTDGRGSPRAGDDRVLRIVPPGR
jgi:glucose/arabinose dehydrogenase